MGIPGTPSPRWPDLVGSIQARGDFGKDPHGNASVNVRLDSTPVTLRLPQQDASDPWQIAFAPGEAAFSLVNDRAELSVELPFVDEGGVSANVQLAEPADGDWLQCRLDGAVVLLWPDIAPLASWLPEVDTLRGRIDGRMQLAGTPAAPQLLGRLALSEGAATLVTPGLALEDVKLELDGQPTGEIRVSAMLRSGGGTLNVRVSLNSLSAVQTSPYAGINSRS